MIPGHATPDELVLDDPTRRLCAAITSGDLAPVRLAVIAPGGYGKSALLDLLATANGARRYRSGATGGLLLVDDAHLLCDKDFVELDAHLADESAGLVIAARPRPRPTGLTTLLGRLRGQVVLRAFDVDRTAACLGALGADPGLAAFVHCQTGGVPGLVHRLAPHLSQGQDTVPAAAIDEFRLDLDQLTADQVHALLAAEVNADATLLGGLLGVPPTVAAAHVDAARATGLLAADGSLLPLAAAVLRALVPADQRTAALGGLAELRLARTGPTGEFAAALLAASASGPAAGAVYAAAAAEAEPGFAVQLHQAAENAGHPVDEIGRAEAEARAGDLDAALRRADTLLAAGEPRAAHVAAAALAHRGQATRSAEMYRWAGAGALAAIGLAGTGRLAEAKSAMPADSAAPPTLFSTAISLAAKGILDSIGGDAGALSTVVRAAEVMEPVGRDVLLPDSPAALGAILAINTGATGIAEPLLARACTGGELLRTRHALLAAWPAMLRGESVPVPDGRQTPRDRLFAVGLAVGAARRDGDLATLRRVWDSANEAVVRHDIDLFTLLPLGEFAIAAARLGELDRFTPHLDRAWTLLAALDNPPAWTAFPRWQAFHAEITASRVPAARDHVEVLSGSTEQFPAALAEAARCWLDVLAGNVNAPRVESAARALHAVGLHWDAARLAGQAATRTADRKRMLALLDCARTLQSGAAREEAATDPTGKSRLSGRELQVAELVLAGLTYKQIGDRLFISAKTVEHHMARMRSRLGATSRTDLLTQLRDMVTPQPPQRTSPALAP
ncbi:helix-turn-helix transcriptional regulator [Actinokineospora globicatena]|uniref:helix-turn-helix transcriptional regulator n=1 Tax=Actinokineospora globicatena TaxID=103729 RepID=UPI0020A2975A|nr:helix-turn-helix transcriptional regulator [Actinokineospora globicatena]MCP2302250.1 regulatory protein, luxR family [Actinokineospora globicatena]GLW76085.1 helix-turn-helix transcriptional regulator [Actinokineospora globicatena]GLW82920.1 helix-turn-helix transcriptional regulator [Actinokineospora globicatena]